MPSSGSSTPLERFQGVVSFASFSPATDMHLPHVKSFANVVDQVREAFKHYKNEKESEAHQVSISFRLEYDYRSPLVCRFFVELPLVTNPKVFFPETCQ
jgi:hypothetical protein